MSRRILYEKPGSVKNDELVLGDMSYKTVVLSHIEVLR